MIIDTHAHIGTLPPFDMTIEQVLYSMDKYGIDFTILSNIFRYIHIKCSSIYIHIWSFSCI